MVVITLIITITFMLVDALPDTRTMKSPEIAVSPRSEARVLQAVLFGGEYV